MAAELKKMFAVRYVVASDVIQSGENNVCRACGLGKIHKKPLVQCYLRHRYTRELDEPTAYMCFVCLKNHFDQTDNTLVLAYKCYNKQQVRRSYPRVFELMETLPVARTHPEVSIFNEYYHKGRSIAPNMASTVLRILLIYSADQSLYDGFVFLQLLFERFPDKRQDAELNALHERFSGAQDIWPTMTQRQRMQEIIRQYSS